MLCLSFTSLLVLVLGVSLGAAFPQGALKKSCSLSKYKFIMRHEMKAARKMTEHFVSTTGNRGLWAGGGSAEKMLSLRPWVTRWMFSRAVWG